MLKRYLMLIAFCTVSHRAYSQESAQCQSAHQARLDQCSADQKAGYLQCDATYSECWGATCYLGIFSACYWQCSSDFDRCNSDVRRIAYHCICSSNYLRELCMGSPNVGPDYISACMRYAAKLHPEDLPDYAVDR